MLLLIATSSCGGGHFYETKAIYFAEGSNLKVNLTSKGYVLDGDDLTEGLTKGIITSSCFSDTIHFQATSKVFILNKSKEGDMVNSTNFEASLEDYLCKKGYSDYKKQELEELKDIIKATAYGPKATYVEGQTDLIKVVSISFNTHRGYGKDVAAKLN